MNLARAPFLPGEWAGGQLPSAWPCDICAAAPPRTCDKNPAPRGGLWPRAEGLPPLWPYSLYFLSDSHDSDQNRLFRRSKGAFKQPGGPISAILRLFCPTRGCLAATRRAQAAEHRRPGVRSAHSADDGPSNAHQKASGGDQGEPAATNRVAWRQRHAL